MTGSAPPGPTAAALNAVLPQTQCTRCGYPDCHGYAEAMAAGQAEINRCPPGGAQGVVRLSRLTGREVRPLDSSCGHEGPRALAIIDEAWCIGCTLCIKACPTDAIVGANKLMHTVMESHCTGCELCVPVCPVDCIAMVPVTPLPADLIAAWLGERKLPVGVKFASFLRFGKELVEANVTVEQMQDAAALYYDGWAAGLAVRTDAALAWETGALINTIRRALVVAGNGITAEHMREFMRAKYAEPDGFWTGKVIPFTYAAENVAIWLKARTPAEDVPLTESGQVDIMAYINNKSFGKGGQS